MCLLAARSRNKLSRNEFMWDPCQCRIEAPTLNPKGCQLNRPKMQSSERALQTGVVMPAKGFVNVGTPRMRAFLEKATDHSS